VKDRVVTALDQELKTPGFGTGVYEREGGLKAGQKKTYDIILTRTFGPSGPLPHLLRLAHLPCRVSGCPGVASRAGVRGQADDANGRR
jgi:hypothetical protein